MPNHKNQEVKFVQDVILSTALGLREHLVWDWEVFRIVIIRWMKHPSWNQVEVLVWLCLCFWCELDHFKLVAVAPFHWWLTEYSLDIIWLTFHSKQSCICEHGRICVWSYHTLVLETYLDLKFLETDEVCLCYWTGENTNLTLKLR